MLLPLTTVALLNAAAVSSPVTTDQLPNLFVAACLDGSARISPGDATAIGFGELPTSLRSRLGQPRSAKIWQLRGSGRAYLYLLDYASKDSDSRVCGVASENLALRSATGAVEARVRGYVSQDPASRSTEWMKSDQGYRALTTRAGGFTILQVNWLRPELAEVPTKQ